MARKQTQDGAITAELRRVLQGEVEKLPQLLEQLTPDQRVKTVMELLRYVAPKDSLDLWGPWI